MSLFSYNEDTMELTIDEFIIHTERVISRVAYGVFVDCTKITTKETLCAKITSFEINNSKCEKEMRMIDTLRTAYLTNQNLVKVYLCLPYQEKLIVIMEKCVTNLEDELKKKGNFGSEEVINILKQLLNGYLPLYQKQIIHRHIKPREILISYDFQGKPIYKLSCSKIYLCQKKSNLTKVGIPLFEPPELNYMVTDTDLDQKLLQLKKIPKGKSQVDVYPIGLMLYYCLFGQYPSRPTTWLEFRSFFNNLKVHPIKIEDKSQNINSDLQEMIERMIVYNPLERITFLEIYSSKLIGIQTQQPVKLFKLTINPESKPKLQDQFSKFNQQQDDQKPLFPCSPIPNDNIEQPSFQQSTTIQQQAQFQQNNEIQIDEYNDSQNYLKAQLSENSLLYSKDTQNLLRQALESIQQFNHEKINTDSVKLMKYFKYEENGSYYTLGFLKFYYCLIIRANKEIIRKQFASEQELRQEITNILEKNDHNIY
ncbi:unnamed protein product [Paramecium octaurelia]|uniref:Protein kinase domain-containing protein n=1 Tax=Paramecium octaurelia TaxID=43137 RepID=A0A8S1WCQ8_PAROT|nr:unnamed protein product [Paramecium octaurelia]